MESSSRIVSRILVIYRLTRHDTVWDNYTCYICMESYTVIKNLLQLAKRSLVRLPSYLLFHIQSTEYSVNTLIIILVALGTISPGICGI
jgi:hypothetical protein